MDTSERVIDSELDDIQGIDLNLEHLYNRFILPIERMRSFSVPTSIERPVINDADSLASDVHNSSDSNPGVPQESRTHTFYRMIGFPVINSNLEFYNPGYDPTLKADQRRKNYDISTKLSQVVRLTHTLRETSVRTRHAVFNRAGVDACIYAIAIAVPGATKPFLQMQSTENFDSINTKDEQVFNLNTRRQYIEPRYGVRNSSITNFFETGSHILRPFNTDPNIIDTVTGLSGESRHVCAPFLKTKGNTGIERNIYAKRPGIEYILRARLKAQDQRITSTVLLNILNSSRTFESLSLVELTQTVSAVLDEQNINNQDIVDRLKNANNIELITLNKLVKTIKGCIDLLIKSIDDVKTVSKKIKWTPLSSEIGPEGGSDITNLVHQKQNTELEKRRLNLSVRGAENKKISQISDDKSILNQDFNLAQFESMEKPWDAQIHDVQEKIDSYQKLGSDSLACIEIITGEISGLGLIDILAIYTALWAVDIKVLISMLDENSFERLYSMQEYRTQDVESRKQTGPHMGILEAMQAFERQVINILSYSDRVFQQKLGSSLNSEGGNVPKVEV